MYDKVTSYKENFWFFSVPNKTLENRKKPQEKRVG